MSEVSAIDACYTVRLPNGETAKVNVFDMNLAHFCDSYVQLEDGSWGKARKLTIIERPGYDGTNQR